MTRVEYIRIESDGSDPGAILGAITKVWLQPATMTPREIEAPRPNGRAHARALPAPAQRPPAEADGRQARPGEPSRADLVRRALATGPKTSRELTEILAKSGHSVNTGRISSLLFTLKRQRQAQKRPDGRWERAGQ